MAECLHSCWSGAGGEPWSPYPASLRRNTGFFQEQSPLPTQGQRNKGSYSGSQPSVKSRVVYANTYRARAPGKEMSCCFPGSKFGVLVDRLIVAHVAKHARFS